MLGFVGKVMLIAFLGDMYSYFFYRVDAKLQSFIPLCHCSFWMYAI